MYVCHIAHIHMYMHTYACVYVRTYVLADRLVLTVLCSVVSGHMGTP